MYSVPGETIDLVQNLDMLPHNFLYIIIATHASTRAPAWSSK